MPANNSGHTVVLPDGSEIDVDGAPDPASAAAAARKYLNNRIAGFRQQYPQYNDLPDDQLADAIHRKFYSDMPRPDFDARMSAPGRTPGETRAAQPGAQRTYRIEAPDGAAYEIDAPDENAAMAAFRSAHQPGQPSGASPSRPAGGTRTITAEGRTITVPADATDGEINEIFGPSPASRSTGAAGSTTKPIQVQGPDGSLVEFPAGTDDATITSAMRRHFGSPDQSALSRQPGQPLTTKEALLDGTRAVAEGGANLLGAPVDLTTGALNLAGAGVNKLFGTNIPAIQEPFGGSEYIKHKAIDPVATWAGAPDPETLSTGNKFAHNVAKDATMLGLGGVAGLARSASGEIAAPAGRLAADLVAPARDLSLKTAAGDLGAAIGMGGAETAVDASKEAIGDGFFGKLLQATAPMIGGLAGAATAGTGVWGLNRAGTAVKNAFFPDPTLPIDPATGRAASPAVTNAAAGRLQGAAVNPSQAADAVDAGATSLRGQDVSTLPSAGFFSDDPGIVGLTDAHARGSSGVQGTAPRMAARERDVLAEVADRNGSIGAGSDPRAPGSYAQQIADTRRAADQQAISAVESRRAALTAQQDQQAAALAPFNADQKAAAGDQLHQTVVDTLRADTARKNQLFQSIEQDQTPRSTEALQDAARQVRETVSDVPPSLRGRVMPAEALAGIDELGPTAPFASFSQIRPVLSDMESSARKGGNMRLADNIRPLKQAVDQEAERMASEGHPLAAAAMDNYREDFAPVWARGPGDEAAKFRSDFNRDPVNQTEVPASVTAKRFLSAPEKAEALTRILNSSGRDPAAGLQAARDFVMSDLVTTGALGNDGRVNLNYLRTWLGKNGQVADTIGVRGQLEDIARQAEGSQTQAAQLAQELSAARDRAHLTSQHIDRGVLGSMLGKDPQNLVESLMSGGDARTSLRDAVSVLKDSPEAMRGLSGAIREWLQGKTTDANVQKTTDGSRPVNAARLEDVLNRFGDALPEALSPSEMMALRTSRAQLRPGMARGTGALGPDASAGGSVSRLVDTAARAHFGAVQGNIVGQLLRTAGGLLPDGVTPNVNRMVADAVDSRPDLLSLLLRRPLPERRPAANWRSNALLGAAVGAADAGRE